MSASPPPSLVADLGATNARFALTDRSGVHDVLILRCTDYATLRDATCAYLEQVQPPSPPSRAAFAIAGPVTEDRVGLTNHAWAFSVSELRDHLGLDRLEVVNDFTAVALSVPHLTDADRRQIGTGKAEPDQPIGVLGPGTGLGVSGLVPSRDRWTALAGEGGHVTMAAVTEREEAVLHRLRQRFNHVSGERCLSGMGLSNLYETLAALDGLDARAREPREVSEAALGDLDPLCVEAVDMFCAMLGTIAGNLALTLGARGGIYVAGGIVPKLGPLFDRSDFRARFEGKGRLSTYLQDIPTYVVTHPTPAFLGLKSVLERPMAV